MSKPTYFETVVFALLGAVLLGLGWLVLQPGLPAFLSGSFLVQQRAGVTAAMLALYGGLLLVCALGNLFLARAGRSLGAVVLLELRATRQALADGGRFVADCFRSRAELLFVTLTLLLGIGVRAFFMGQPMRLDESYTFLYYLNRGQDPFFYSIPNNHVLHTLLAWVSVAIGGMSPLAVRMPAFLAGVLCIPLMFLVCKAFDPHSGLLAALAMAVFPYMVLYSTTARGYSLLVLLGLLLVLAGKMQLDRPSPAGAVLVALVSALGLLTMPTMVFLLAGFYLWLLPALWFKTRDARLVLRDFLIPAVVWSMLLTVVFYTPTVISSNGAQAIFSNRYVDSLSWNEFLTRLLPHLRQIQADFTRSLPRLADYGLVAFMLAGLFAAWRKRAWAALGLLPAVLAGSALVFLAKHAIPFVRNWIFLIPFGLLLADLGATYLLELLPNRLRWAGLAAVLLGGALLAGSLVSKDAIAAYPDTGLFPEGAVVAQYLKPLMSGNEYIVVRDPANYVTFYYLCYDDAPPMSPGIDPAIARRYYITQQGQQTLADLTSEAATPLFTYGDAVIYTATGGGAAPHFPGYVFDCRNTRK